MTTRTWTTLALLLTGSILLTAVPGADARQEKEFFKKKGGPGGGIRKLVKQFDKDGDGRLNRKERDAAREFLKKERAQGGGGFRGPGGPGGGFMLLGPPQPGQILPGPMQDRLELTDKQKKEVAELQKEVDARLAKLLNDKQKKSLADLRANPFGPGGPPMFGGQNREPPKPGPKVRPDEVALHPKSELYAPDVLRTFFLEFEDKDWEDEMADFYHTDVEIPATLIVDGKKYPNVGVRFRGMSSYFRFGKGFKRSLNVTVDFVDKNQRVYGYKTLNLLNGADDPSFLHTVLYSQLSREHIPAPKANLAKVVINGESWGVYTNVQQFNREFTKEFFKSTKGARWKVQGGPGGGGGLEYTGDNVEDYKRRFTIKSKEDEKAWKALVNLCKVLNQTPPDKLEAALKPILDIDGALWFLALDVALINNDGYWTRASDYSIYLDPKGKFHIIPHDMNETFSTAMGFGFGPGGPGGGRGGPGGPGGGPPGMGGPQGGGFELDPLVALNNSRMPLRSKLLAVPALKERYLKNVRAIAERQLDWKKLGPVVEGYRKLIEKEVEADTKKIYTLAAFTNAVADKPAEPAARGVQTSLRTFADKRREYLLQYAEPKAKE
jgi:spore coat protein CotH